MTEVYDLCHERHVELGDDAVTGLFASFDLDHNDRLSTSEFEQMLQALFDMTPAKLEQLGSLWDTTVDTLLRAIDADRSGRIDVNELRRILCNLGEEVTMSQVESLIKSADTDGNGAIDYDEFTKILLAERTTRFAPVSGGGGFLGVSPA